MSDEVVELLQTLAALALEQVPRLPSPADPAPDAWEEEADAYCIRLAGTFQVEMPTPGAAYALLPRLKAARIFSSAVEHSLELQRRLGDASANESTLLEMLLIKLWHRTWKSSWLAGEFESPPPPS